MKNLGFHERLGLSLPFLYSIGETDYQTAVNMLACVTESSPTLLIVEFCAKGDLLGHMRKWFVLSQPTISENSAVRHIVFFKL